MKKIAIITFVFLALSVPSAFAISVASTTGTDGFLDLSTGSMTADTIDPIGLSPKVVGYYTSTGNSAETTQWYAIATVHLGGNLSYGTAQDLNNIYKSEFVTGTSVTTELEGIPSTAASASVWDTWGNI